MVALPAVSARAVWTAMLALLVGCGGAPRVRCADGRLVVVDAPAGVIRDDLLYVMGPAPIPGSETRPKVGLVQGLDRVGDALYVSWYCPPARSAAVVEALSGAGLPAALVGQDRLLRLGRCWTRATIEEVGEQAGEQGGGAVIVRLDLGADDGVRAGDRYALLGEGRADRVNRRVPDFESLGTCVVLPHRVEARRAACEVLPPHGLGGAQRGGPVNTHRLEPAVDACSLQQGDT